MSDKAHALIGVSLMVPFYLVWILGYLNAIPLILYEVLEMVLSIMFIIGLAILFLPITHKIINLTRKDKYFLAIIILMALFITLGASLSYVKYLTYNAYAWDLGIFMQALFSTAFYHKLLYYTVELFTNPSGSFLGVHFSLILFTLVPIYYLYPHSITLLVIQAVLLYTPVMPLYLIALCLTRNESIAFITSLMYLLSPDVASPLYFDFHVEAFIPLLYIVTVLFITMRRWVPAMV